MVQFVMELILANVLHFEIFYMALIAQIKQYTYNDNLKGVIKVYYYR